LVIDDDVRMLRLVTQQLEASGHSPTGVADGLTALQALEADDFELIIIDVGLPGMDGFQVTERIRSRSDAPIIILTGHTETTTKLRGFRMGADDYVVKPFNSDELEARVRAVMRRTRATAPRGSETAGGHQIVGDFEVIEAQHLIGFRGEDVKPTRMEFKLLWQLLLAPNVVLPHTELLAAAWGPEYANDLGYLRVYIRRLREKIEPAPCGQRLSAPCKAWGTCSQRRAKLAAQIPLP